MLINPAITGIISYYEFKAKNMIFLFSDTWNLFCSESASRYIRAKSKVALTVQGFHCCLVLLSDNY
jgi:hypothetical protein